MKPPMSLVLFMLLFVGGAASAESQPLPSQPAELIRLLGDPSYAVRERAQEKLYRLGRTAAGDLKKGLADPDAEVRRRCDYLYPLALRSDQEIQLEAFLNDEAGKLTAPPGWQKFRQAAGTDRAARALFLDIYRHDKTFGETLEKNPIKIGEQFQARAQKMQQGFGWRRVGGKDNEGSTPADMAMLLISAAHANSPQSQNSFWMLTNCFYQGTAQSDLQSSPALRRLLVPTLTKHINDPNSLQQIVQISTMLQLNDFQENTLKPAVRKLAKTAGDGDGSQVGNIALMANQLNLTDAMEALKPAVRKAAQAFAKNPNDWMRFYNANNAAIWINMPEVVEDTIKPAVVKMMSTVADKPNDQNQFFQAFQFGQQLGLQNEIDTVLKPAANKLVASLVKEPTDQNKFMQALNVVQMMDLPDARDKVLKPAARKLIADAAKTGVADFNKLIQAANIANQLGIREETDKVLQPLVVKHAEAAAKSADLDKLSQSHTLASNLAAQKVIDDVIKPSVRKALEAAAAKPIKANNIQQCLNLAKQLDLKEGLALAIKAVGQKDLDVNSRAYAVVYTAEVGGKDQMTKLEPLLNDKTSLGQTNVGGTAMKTEMRDVALAALVTTDGGQLADYGFVFPNFWGAMPISSVPPQYLGFADGATRDAALKKWKERVPAKN